MPLSPEQLEIRKTRIGSSDIAAIAGVSPFKTPLDVYWSKVGPDEDRFRGNTNTEFGDAFEPVIGEMYAKRFNLHRLAKCHETLLHPEYKGVSATPDFFVCNSTGNEPVKIIETKNVGWRGMANYGDEYTEDYPEWHRVQMAWQLCVTDLPEADLAAYFGGSDLRIFTFKRDMEVEKLLLQLAEKFYIDHLLKKIPPSPQSPSDMQNFLNQKYKKNNGKLLEANDLVLGMMKDLADARRAAKAAEKAVTAAQAALQAVIGDADGIVAPDGKVTWKLQTRKAYEVKESTFRQLRCSGALFKGIDE